MRGILDVASGLWPDGYGPNLNLNPHSRRDPGRDWLIEIVPWGKCSPLRGRVVMLPISFMYTYISFEFLILLPMNAMYHTYHLSYFFKLCGRRACALGQYLASFWSPILKLHTSRYGFFSVVSLSLTTSISERSRAQTKSFYNPREFQSAVNIF